MLVQICEIHAYVSRIFQPKLQSKPKCMTIAPTMDNHTKAKKPSTKGSSSTQSKSKATKRTQGGPSRRLS